MPGLHVICGPMYSGKTDALIRRVKEAQAKGVETAVFVHRLGVHQNGVKLWSRSGLSIEAMPVESAQDIRDVSLEMKVGGLLAIDEAHFLTLDDARRLFFSLSRWYDVLVAGLDTNFGGESFPAMAYLIVAAETVQALTAVCATCGAPATRTQRLIDGRPAPWDSPIIMPGDKDMYQPRCVQCHEVPGRPEVMG